MVQMQSRASPGLTRSCSSTWLERIIPSQPLASNWQSEERQTKAEEAEDEEGGGGDTRQRDSGRKVERKMWVEQGGEEGAG